MKVLSGACAICPRPDSLPTAPERSQAPSDVIPASLNHWAPSCSGFSHMPAPVSGMNERMSPPLSSPTEWILLSVRGVSDGGSGSSQRLCTWASEVPNTPKSKEKRKEPTCPCTWACPRVRPPAGNAQVLPHISGGTRFPLGQPCRLHKPGGSSGTVTVWAGPLLLLCEPGTVRGPPSNSTAIRTPTSSRGKLRPRAVSGPYQSLMVTASVS